MSNVFRKEYRKLSEAETARIAAIKDKAEELYSMLAPTTATIIESPRELALARTKLEECVMWAVKGLT